MTYHLRVFNSMATWDFLKITQPYIALCILLASSSPAESYAQKKVSSKVSARRSNLSCQVRLLRFSWEISVGCILYITAPKHSCSTHCEQPVLQHRPPQSSFRSLLLVFIPDIFLSVYTPSQWIGMTIKYEYLSLVYSTFITLKYFLGFVWFSPSCCAEVHVWQDFKKRLLMSIKDEDIFLISLQNFFAF